MDKLGFYPLSVILSFLSETDGTCLLLTKKYYAKQVLPLFRLRPDPGLVILNAPRNRHRFKVSPVQDPIVLLQRLNTRRLKKRQRNSLTYQTDLDITELATLEWSLSQKQFKENGIFLYPPQLELLQFLDRSTDDKLQFMTNSGVTLLVSYPRSGNTLLRTMLERTTGTVTGSDTRPDRTLSKALAEAHGLVGEGITQGNKSCFAKTHWPERIGCRVVEGNRVILIVRNPFDAIDSYWNLNVTNTHTETVTDEIYEHHKEMFEGLVKNEIKIWHEFHAYWLRIYQEHSCPLLLIRFEDLIQNPEREMMMIMSFLSTNNEPLSPFWNARIQHVTNTTKSSSLGSYQPRSATTGVKSVGKSLKKGRYSPEMIQVIHSIEDECAKKNKMEQNLLKKFGYDVIEQQFPENFIQGTAPTLRTEEILCLNNSGSTRTTVKVNVGDLVRPRDCPFGRVMRNWRRQHTNNDTEPFPTVPRQSR